MKGVHPLESYRTAWGFYPEGVTLQGPSKTIVVEPLEHPAQEPGPEPKEPEPKPEPERVPAE